MYLRFYCPRKTKKPRDRKICSGCGKYPHGSTRAFNSFLFCYMAVLFGRVVPMHIRGNITAAVSLWARILCKSMSHTLDFITVLGICQEVCEVFGGDFLSCAGGCPTDIRSAKSTRFFASLSARGEFSCESPATKEFGWNRCDGSRKYFMSYADVCTTDILYMKSTFPVTLSSWHQYVFMHISIWEKTPRRFRFIYCPTRTAHKSVVRRSCESPNQRGKGC